MASGMAMQFLTPIFYARVGDATDGAEAAAFLLSEQARWITGQVLHLDGGFSAIRPYVKL